MGYIKLALNSTSEVTINITQDNYKKVLPDIAQALLNIAYDEEIKTTKNLNTNSLLGLELAPKGIETTDKDTWSAYAKGFNSSKRETPRRESTPRTTPVRKYENDGPRRILVMTKCKCCGTKLALVDTKFTLTTTTYKCRECSSDITIGKITPAEYTCSCGANSTLFITDDCTDIKCKKCKSDILLEYDKDRQCYMPIKINNK